MADNQLVLYKDNPVHGPRNSVASLFARVLGARLDLRRGGLLPEELPRAQAERLMALLKSRLVKQVDPATGEVSYVLARAGIVAAPTGEPCLANLCREAQTVLADAIRVLPAIHALDPAGDPELVEARKAILESEFKALLHEACQQQPRFLQIERLLSGARANIIELVKECGSAKDEKSVNTPEEDSVVISLRVLNDYIEGLDRSFRALNIQRLSLACLLREITFALQAIGETVSQARTQLAEDGVTEADLQVFRPLRKEQKELYGEHENVLNAETLTAEAFLSLSEYEAERMIEVVERGGKIGALSIKTYANGIVEQFNAALGAPQNYHYLHHLTRDETRDLIRTLARTTRAAPKPEEKEFEAFRSDVSPTVFEFIRRYPRTLFFLFKLQAQWEEVLALVDKVSPLETIAVASNASDQWGIQR